MNQNDANFPIFEEGKLRPPNKCHVTLIRAQRPLLRGTAVQAADYFQNGEFPSSHHREEGWPSDQENIAQHPLFARTGWCSDRWDKEHHPGGVHKEASRLFLGDAATPPRGDARRGIRSFQNETPQPHIAVSAALDAPLNNFRNPNLDRCGFNESLFQNLTSAVRTLRCASRM